MVDVLLVLMQKNIRGYFFHQEYFRDVDKVERV